MLRTQMMKVSLQLVVGVFCTFPLLCPGQDFSRALAKMEQSTVLVKTYDRYHEPIGIGTAFFINSTGVLVTNAHVLERAASALVKLDKGTYTTVEAILGIYESQDVAFVQTGLESSTPVLFADSGDFKRGSHIGVLGNPAGLEFSFSTGVISAVRKTDDVDIIQITAPISHGSSGGPIFTADGKVLAMATMFLRDGQNLNFGIGAKTLLKLMKRTKSEPQREWAIYDPFRDQRIQTQLDMNMSAIERLQQTEEIHQRVYDEIMAIYADDKIFTRQLREAQRAWIKFRDAHLRAMWPKMDSENPRRLYGSVFPMCLTGLQNEVTRARVEQLLIWRKGVQEGDVCSGTIANPDWIKKREVELVLTLQTE